MCQQLNYDLEKKLHHRDKLRESSKTFAQCKGMRRNRSRLVGAEPNAGNAASFTNFPLFGKILNQFKNYR